MVPKSIDKNGRTLSLQGINWQVISSDNMGYSQIPTGYTAVATYSGLASGTKVSGYIASVTYSGEVVKQLVGKSTYTIVYEGEQIIIPFNFIPLLTAGLIVAGCIVLCVTLWKTRKNAEIYTMQQGEPVLYGKARVKPKCPVLDTRNVETEARVVLDRKLQKQLMEFDSTIVIRGRYKNFTYPTSKNRTLLIAAPSPDQNSPEWDGMGISKTEHIQGGTANE